MCTDETQRPFVSVIIPVYNDPEGLRGCLQALERQTYPPDRFEVIVVDNRSDLPIAPVTQAFPHVRTARENKPGSYTARNTGIRLARGEILAFTDADCLPDPDWIANGVTYLTQTPHCGLLAGKIEIFSQNPNKPTACELYEQLFYLNQERLLRSGHFGATANLFTFRAVVEKVGAFDAEFKSSGDKEWGKRVYAHGYSQIYREDVCIRHPARNSLRALYRKTIRIAGGVHDLRRKSTESSSPSGTARLKAWLPPYRLMGSVLAGKASKKLSGIGQRLQVMMIVLFLHYSYELEFLRLALGGRSKNY